MKSTASCTGIWFTLCIVVTLAIIPDVDWNKEANDAIENTLKMEPNNNIAKNTVLFVGDGMGMTTIMAARVFKGQQEGRTGEEEYLSFEKFPHVAFSKTYNVDYQVPDSAGTATAFLCGVKTNYGLIGVNHYTKNGDCKSQKGNEVSSILKWAQDAGKFTGIVTTTRITHATPASAYAHAANRYWEGDATFKDEKENATKYGCEDIASQLVTQEPGRNLNVIFGGGRRFMMRREDEDPEHVLETGERLDGRNLIEEWIEDKKNRSLSHKYVYSQAQFDDIDELTTDHVLGLFERNHMQYEAYRKDDSLGEPSLAEMTEKAINILKKNANGFVLLVEGGRIDHAHHDNKAHKSLMETVSFSNAVETAQSILDDSDSLLIVTADHSHVFTVGGYPTRGNPILGFQDSTYQASSDGMPYHTLSYGNGPGASRNGARVNRTGNDYEHFEYRQEALVPTLDETHGGEDVPIYATGAMAHLFHGVQEQHYIAHALAYASCIGQYSSRPQCQGYSIVPDSLSSRCTKLEIHILMLILVLLISFSVV